MIIAHITELIDQELGFQMKVRDRLEYIDSLKINRWDWYDIHKAKVSSEKVLELSCKTVVYYHGLLDDLIASDKDNLLTNVLFED